MSVKTTLTLDNKVSYDLLVRTLQLRYDELKMRLDQPANGTDSRWRDDTFVVGERQSLLKECGALEMLIRQVT